MADDLGPDPGGSSVDSGVGEVAGGLSQPEPYRSEKSPGGCGEEVVAGGSRRQCRSIREGSQEARVMGRSLKKARGMMQAQFVSAWPCDGPR